MLDHPQPFTILPHDALVVTDLQNDFLPGGSLAVPTGDAVIAPINRLIERFAAAGQPIVLTRDWHPPDHCSFRPYGGRWPVHCVAGTTGAEFAPALRRPATAMFIAKAVEPDREAYSAFSGTLLHDQLLAHGVQRIFLAGLATDYCVLNTALDGLRLGYVVVVVADAIRAVDLQPSDGQHALQQMTAGGAKFMQSTELG